MADPRREQLEALIAADPEFFDVELPRIFNAINNLRRIAEIDPDDDVSGIFTELEEGFESFAAAGGTDAKISVSLRESDAKPIADKETAIRLILDVAKDLTSVSDYDLIDIAGNLMTFNDLSQRDIETGELAVSDRIASRILQTNRWARTFPDQPLTEDIVAALASNMLDRGVERGGISQKQYDDIVLGRDNEFTVGFYEDFEAKESEMRADSFELHGNVGPLGGDPKDLDVIFTRQANLELASGIEPGSGASFFPAMGRTPSEIREEQRFTSFSNILERKGVKAAAEAALRAAGIDPTGTDLTGDQKKAFDAAFKKMVARLDVTNTKLEGQFSQQEVAAKIDAEIQLKMAPGGEFAQDFSAERARLDAKGVETFAKAKERVNEAFAPFGMSAESISPEALERIIGTLTGDQSSRRLDTLTPDFLSTLVENKAALDDPERTLGAFGLGQPGTAGAFQENIRENVIPSIEDEIRRRQEANPFASVQDTAQSILGFDDITPFEEGLRQRQFRGAFTAGEGPRGELGAGTGLAPITAADIFEAFRESQPLGAPEFGVAPFQVDPTGEAFRRQFDESQIPGFSQKEKDALIAIGEEGRSPPDFTNRVVTAPFRPSFEVDDIDELTRVIRELAGGDPDFLAFLQERIGGEESTFGEEFRQFGADEFARRRAAIRAEALSLEKAQFDDPQEAIPNVIDPVTGEIIKHGRRAFTPSVAVDLVRQRLAGVQTELNPFRASDFIRQQGTALRSEFRSSPAFQQLEASRAESAESQRLRDIDEAELERRLTLRSRPRRAFT